MQKVLLFNRNESELGTIPDSITLLEPFTNYDFLEFICADNDDITTRYTLFVAVSALNEISVNGNNYFYMRPAYNSRYGWNFNVNSSTHLIKYSGTKVSPKEIYGIKI